MSNTNDAGLETGGNEEKAVFRSFFVVASKNFKCEFCNNFKWLAVLCDYLLFKLWFVEMAIDVLIFDSRRKKNFVCNCTGL